MDDTPPVRTESDRKVIRSSTWSPGVPDSGSGRDGLGRGFRPATAASRAREERIAWALEHFPQFNCKLVSHAADMAERRPGGEATVESVAAELNRMGAVPLEAE